MNKDVENTITFGGFVLGCNLFMTTLKLGIDSNANLLLLLCDNIVVTVIISGCCYILIKLCKWIFGKKEENKNRNKATLKLGKDLKNAVINGGISIVFSLVMVGFKLATGSKPKPLRLLSVILVFGLTSVCWSYVASRLKRHFFGNKEWFKNMDT
jgi:hypothetical protein